MQLNAKSNLGVIWFYILPSKFRGIYFFISEHRNAEINGNSRRKTCKNRYGTFEIYMPKAFRKLFVQEYKLMFRL